MKKHCLILGIVMLFAFPGITNTTNFRNIIEASKTLKPPPFASLPYDNGLASNVKLVIHGTDNLGFPYDNEVILAPGTGTVSMPNGVFDFTFTNMGSSGSMTVEIASSIEYGNPCFFYLLIVYGTFPSIEIY